MSGKQGTANLKPLPASSPNFLLSCIGLAEYRSQQALWFAHGLQPFLVIAVQSIKNGRAVGRNAATLAASDLATGAIE